MGIELKDVKKYYGPVHALDGIGLKLEGHKIYGLLGNNGAGKSTLLNIITNRIYPDSGSVTIDGVPADLDRALGKVFMVGEENLYPDNMKVVKALNAAQLFYPDFDMGYALSLAKQFELDTKKKITSLSTGYRSIFRLVLALSCGAPYLLLDEPVLGLDAQHRDMFYKMLILRFSEKPCTVVVSTHIIGEVEKLIEHTLIIHSGHILRNAPTSELLACGYTVSGPSAAVDAYTKGKKVLSSEKLGGLSTASVEGAPDDNHPEDLEFSHLNLQDYFINLMNAEGKTK